MIIMMEAGAISFFEFVKDWSLCVIRHYLMCLSTILFSSFTAFSLAKLMNVKEDCGELSAIAR